MYLLGEGVEKDPETAANLMHFIEEEEKKLDVEALLEEALATAERFSLH